MKDKDEILDDNLIYEIGYHLLPIIEETEIPAEASKIKSIIEDGGGIFLSEEMPKMLVLAYDISKAVDSKKQKFSKAYFGSIKFEVEPSKIADIKNKIETIQDILRFLIIKTVREDTMHIHKIPMFKKESNKDKEEKSEEHIQKPKATEAEIDKSIDELIIEN